MRSPRTGRVSASGIRKIEAHIKWRDRELRRARNMRFSKAALPLPFYVSDEVGQ